MWSIVEEVARRWIATCTDQEQGWVPRHGRESWLGLVWEVQSLRRGAAVLGRSHEQITVSEGGSLATRVGHDGRYRTATSKTVLRAGCHCAQFTVVSGLDMLFGVIRPGWDVEGTKDAADEDGHCFYCRYTYTGTRQPGYSNWEGRQHAIAHGDRIGMLLDLDQGSMTVYKNDERLGVMATGLSGEYSWAVTWENEGDESPLGLSSQSTQRSRRSARIGAAPAPASPTVEELAQAVAYQAEQGGDAARFFFGGELWEPFLAHHHP
jgi:hypothetical protein